MASPAKGADLFRPHQSAGAQPQLEPEYKVIRDLRGGLNTSKTPDQLEDNESPDCSNIIYQRTAIAPDFGITPLGTQVYGDPLNSFGWSSSNNLVYDILVTTRTVYFFSAALLDWIPIPSTATTSPTVATAVYGAGTNPTVAFAGSANWNTGDTIAVQLSTGGWLIGVASGTTSPVTIATPLAAGVSVVTPGTVVGSAAYASAGTIYPVMLLTADGSLPVTGVADPIRRYFIMTNGFDLPFTFDGNIIAVLAGVSGVFTNARFVTRFHNVTVFGAVTEGGIFYTYRIRRSATADSTNYTTLDAGFDDLSDTADDITGLYIVGANLVIPRRDTIMLASYYGNGQQVFWYVYALNNIGAIGLQATDITKLGSIIVDITGIYAYNGDYGITDIGENVFYTILSYTGNLNPATHDDVLVNYLTILDETWVTYTDVYNQYPNNLLRFSHKTQSWFFRKFGNGLFFRNISEITYTTAEDWLQLAGTNWLARNTPWNARKSTSNFPSVLMCGATDNQVYVYNFRATTDNGAAIPWYYCTKDYAFPEDWATIDGLVMYGQGQVDRVEVSLNYGVSFHTIGQSVLFGSNWARMQLDCSFTGEFIRVRFSGSDPSFKLSWFAFKTMSASER